MADLIERAARAAHLVNAAYCQALGDNSQPTWEDAPDWQKDSARNGARLHLEVPDAGPQASHESWMAQKQAEGWVYGPKKDPEKKEHHCMVPFEQLPREQQAKDFIFRSVVHAVAADELLQRADAGQHVELRAQRMWDAYSQRAGGLTFDGKPLPTWAELGDDRRSCWLAAAAVPAV